jgi:hypothetical protein
MRNPGAAAGRWLSARTWLWLGTLAVLVVFAVAGAIRFHRQPWLVAAVALALLLGPVAFAASTLEFRALARLAGSRWTGLRRVFLAGAIRPAATLTMLVLAVSPFTARWAALLVLVPSSGE